MKTFKKVLAVALSVAAALTIGTTNVMAVDNTQVVELPKNFEEVTDEILVHYYDTIMSRDLFGMTLIEETDEILVHYDTIMSRDLSGMTLIEETETIEDGLRIVDKTYVEIVSTNSDSSPKTQNIYKQRAIYDNGGSYGTTYGTMYIWGTFTSDGDTARVTSPGRNYGETTMGEGTYIGDKKFTYASDQGSNFWGNKYAYIEYIVTVRLESGEERDFRLWVDVDCNGDVHVYG